MTGRPSSTQAATCGKAARSARAATAARHAAETGLFSADLEKLAPLVRAGWVVADGGRVAIVRHGAELARLVASAFDAYLGTGGRHSVAV